ncbi:hypothetical protein BC828DRAFT_415572 [Blastocladiella britannica]|nr:hypothetical protein BC828DRAFT_415572 [Blastocladiella britannica]
MSPPGPSRQTVRRSTDALGSSNHGVNKNDNSGSIAKAPTSATSSAASLKASTSRLAPLQSSASTSPLRHGGLVRTLGGGGGGSHPSSSEVLDPADGYGGGSGASLSITSQPPHMSRAASRRSSIVNLAGTASIGDLNAAMAQLTPLLPPIGGAGLNGAVLHSSGSRPLLNMSGGGHLGAGHRRPHSNRAQTLWNLIRTFVSRKFFSTFMSGALQQHGPLDFVTHMSTVWAALEAQQSAYHSHITAASMRRALPSWLQVFDDDDTVHPFAHADSDPALEAAENGWELAADLGSPLAAEDSHGPASAYARPHDLSQTWSSAPALPLLASADGSDPMDWMTGMSLESLSDIDLMGVLAAVLQGLAAAVAAELASAATGGSFGGSSSNSGPAGGNYNGSDPSPGDGPAASAHDGVPTSSSSFAAPPTSSSSSSSTGYFHLATHTTAWRLLVLALRAREPTYRRLTLSALAAVAPSVVRTLADAATQWALARKLLEVATGDEHAVLRHHAVHVLGEIFGLHLARIAQQMGGGGSNGHGAHGDGSTGKHGHGSTTAAMLAALGDWGAATDGPVALVFSALCSAVHRQQAADRAQIELFPQPADPTTTTAAAAADTQSPTSQAPASISPGSAQVPVNVEAIVAKIYLFTAIGKFVRPDGSEPPAVKAVVLYLVWVELQHILPNMRHVKAYVGVIQTVMRILTSIQPNETNKAFIGAMFKTHIQPMMRLDPGLKHAAAAEASSNSAAIANGEHHKVSMTAAESLAVAETLRRLAVQFTSLWLPITRDGARAAALTVLQNGCQALDHLLSGSSSIAGSAHAAHWLAGDLTSFHSQLQDERARAATRARVLWQLLQMPGMTARLSRVPGAARGWFGTPDELVDLPGSVAAGLRSSRAAGLDNGPVAEDLMSSAVIRSSNGTFGPGASRHSLSMQGTTSRSSQPAAGATPGKKQSITAAAAAAAAATAAANNVVPVILPTCNMPLTGSIVVHLPDASGAAAAKAGHGLHNNTIVYITRPLPRLQGVPENATTVPPVFMDPSWASKLQQGHAQQLAEAGDSRAAAALVTSAYERRERAGRVPCLPVGYTYSPAPIPPPSVVEVPGGKSTSAPKSNIDPRMGLRVGVTSSDFPTYRKVPFGFVTRPVNVDVSSIVPEHGDLAVLSGGTVIRRPSLGLSLSHVSINEISESQESSAEVIAPPPSQNRRDLAAKLHAEPGSPASFRGQGGSSAGGLAMSLLDAASHADLVEEEEDDASRRASSSNSTGYTFERIPAVFPVAQGSLSQEAPTTEFLLNAPVVLDVIEPTRARRIVARIVSINKCFEPVAVNGAGYLSPGARFNLHIRPRLVAPLAPRPVPLARKLSIFGSQVQTASPASTSRADLDSSSPQLDPSRGSMGSRIGGETDNIDDEEAEWITIQLQVEEDTIPPLEVLRNAQSALSQAPLVSCGSVQDGSSYFAPPANPSPLPYGFTRSGEAYYPQPPALCPIPAGLLGNGRRYFFSGAGAGVSWDSTTQTQHGITGFDCRGHPFFLPKGCKIPAPTGYTTYGVPYYDLSSILLERGILMEPTFPTASSAHLSWDAAHRVIGSHKVEAGDEEDAPEIWMPEPGDEDYIEPRGIDFIRQMDDLAYLTPPGIKTILEPPALQFQSVTGVVVKPCILKFRALRGDHSERDYFFTVEPMDVFSVDMFHVRLQAEGMVQVKVSCSSSRIKFTSVEGTLSLIDETGRRLVTCRLTATRKSFVRIHPQYSHCGWVMPNQTASMSFTCENVSSTPVHLVLKRPINPGPFYMQDEMVKLQSKESKLVQVTFEPEVVGAFETQVFIEAPGGEVITVRLAGVCGVPLALHTESLDDSALGPDVIARERSAFVTRVFKLLENGESVLSVNERHLHGADEQALFTSLLFAMDPIGRRRNHIVIDFGVLPAPMSTSAKALSAQAALNQDAEEGQGDTAMERSAVVLQQRDSAISLCLTLFNVSAEALTCSLHSTSPALEFDSLVRVAPHKANTIRIDLRPTQLGEFCSLITLTCPGFSSMPCIVRGYVGCPISICTTPTVWMCPGNPNEASKAVIPIVNSSSADISVTVEMATTCNRFTLAGQTLLPRTIREVAGIDRAVETRQHQQLQTLVSLPIVIPAHAVVDLTVECSPAGQCIETASLSLVVDTRWALSSPPVTFISMPLWNALIKQDLESLMHWLHQTAQLFPAPPVNAPPPLVNNHIRDDLPPVMTATFRTTSKKMVSPQTVFLYNPLTAAAPFALLLSPGFSLSRQTSNYIKIGPNDSLPLGCTFRTDINTEVHGFMVAYPERSLAVATPLVSSPLLMVFPSPSVSSRGLEIDFGILESGTNRTSEWCIRSALLVNSRDANVMWTCRLVVNRNRHCPFEVLTTAGDLHPMQGNLVRFDVAPTVQGAFDATCEIVAKEHLTSPPTIVCTITLRVRVVLTQVIGLPDAHDFGSCVVGSELSHQFTLENIGNSDANVSLIPRSPFDIVPSSFKLPALGGQQVVTLSFAPTESSKDSLNRIACFINHRVHMIRVLGKSGFVDLASNNHHNILDYGSVSSTCIAWMNVYVTNRGTLPLRLEHIISPRSEILSLELMGKQLMVQGSTMSVKRDGWAIVRSKIKALALIGHFLRYKLKPTLTRTPMVQTEDERPGNGLSRRMTVIPSSSVLQKQQLQQQQQQKGIRLPIASEHGVALSDLISKPEELILEPMYSFVFRLGFSTVHQTRQTTDLNIYYVPVISNPSPSATRRLTFTVTGYIYRVLDFHPSSVNFGLVPVSFVSTNLRHVLESTSSARPMPNGRFGQDDDNGGGSGDSDSLGPNAKVVRISNMSIENQTVSLLMTTSSGTASTLRSSNNANLTLLSSSGNAAVLSPGNGSPAITVSTGGTMQSAFRFEGRSWTLGPGESVRVPVRFIPARPQMQYHGEALLQHSHGVTILRFSGTGASAEVTHPSRVHFGAVAMNQEGSASFTVHNKGLLPSDIHCQMLSTSVFSFDGPDPFDLELTLDPGSSVEIDLLCMCKQQVPYISSGMRLTWRRSPEEPPESEDMTLSVDVGYPMFAIDQLELDFGVTYTKNVQTIRFRNEGNAACGWSIKADCPLVFSRSRGTMPPLSSDSIEVIFQPTSFDPLEANIEFTTDAGTKMVLAYGIVGVPYLKIPDELLIYDFGIIEVANSHTVEIPLINTGTRQIEYTVELQHSSDAAVFSVEPLAGFIDGGATHSLLVTAHPTVFSHVYSCPWIVRTADGERYDGGFSCIGGQAIVTISRLFGSSGTSRPGTGDPLEDARLAKEDAQERQKSINERFVPQAAMAILDYTNQLKAIAANLSSDDARELEAQVRAMDQARQAKNSNRLTSPNSPAAVGATPPSPSSGRVFSGRPSRLVLPATPPSAAAAAAAGPKPPPRSPLAAEISEREDGLDVEGLLPSRPSTQSSAKMRWLEGSLFNLRDVQRPVELLLAKAEDLNKRIAAQAELAKKPAGGEFEEDTPSTRPLPSGRPRPLIRGSTTASMGGSTVSLTGSSTDDLGSSQPRSRLSSRAARESMHSLLRPVTANELQSHIEEVKRVMETLQLHIPHVTDSQNVHLLSDAVEGLLKSSAKMESVLYVPPSETTSPTARPVALYARSPIQKVFDLGLLKQGDFLEDYSMFDLPNTGNMPFAFGVNVIPITMRPYFAIKPLAGHIVPGGSVQFLLTFQAISDGDFRAEVEIMKGDTPVLAVAVVAKVGSPKIEVDLTALDFGLVLRATTATLPFIIRNTGSYRDTVDLALDSPYFAMDWPGRSARILPGENVVIPVNFSPKSSEPVAVKWMLFPLSRQPISIALSGEGAAPEIKVTPSKLQFGQMFVGDTRTMDLEVHNFGNWDAQVLPRLTHPAFSMAVVGHKPLLPGDAFAVQAKQSAVFQVKLLAEDRGNITATLVLEEQTTKERSTIPLMGFVGHFDCSMDGTVRFPNIKIEELATQLLLASNAGDFAAKLKVKLEPASLESVFSLTIKDEAMKMDGVAEYVLAPGSDATELVISTCPKSSINVDGTLTVTLSSTVDGAVREKLFEYPFAFYAFEDPVVVDNRKEAIDVGTWAIGKTTDWSFNVTNFDNVTVSVRVRMEVPASKVTGATAAAAGGSASDSKAPKDKDKGKAGAAATKKGAKKKGAAGDTSAATATTAAAANVGTTIPCWTLLVPQLELPTGDSGTLRAKFTALDDAGAEQAAFLFVEYSIDGGSTFKPLHRYKVEGKSGRPKIELSTSNLDFGFVPCGTRHARAVKLANKGTASIEWALDHGWANDDIFSIIDRDVFDGIINPGDELEFVVQFETSVTFDFTSELTFVIGGGDERFKAALHGQGCVYRIYGAGLPRDVQLMGSFLDAAVATYSFSVHNDCVFSVPLQLAPVCQTQSELYAHNLTVQPPELTLLANSVPDCPSNERQSLKCTIQLSAINTSSLEECAHLLEHGLQYSIGISSPMLADQYSIPIQVSFSLEPLILSVTSLAFGKVPFDTERTSPAVIVTNRNAYAIPLTTASSHPLIKADVDTLVVPANGEIEFEVHMFPKKYANEADIPSSYPVNGVISLSCAVLKLEYKLETTGSLVDVSTPPSFDDIDFGPAFVTTTVTRKLTFQNWGRKPLEYQYMVPDDSLAEAGIAFLPTAGKRQLASRATAETEITFTPNRAAAVQLPVTLVTSAGAFSFSLRGKGIAPEVELDVDVVDFGLIGVGFPETRAIHVTNVTPLPLELLVVLEGVGSRPSSASAAPTHSLLADVANTEETSRPYSPTPMSVFQHPSLLLLGPNAFGTIPVQFHPRHPNLALEGQFKLQMLGSTVTQFKAKGRTGRFELVVVDGVRPLVFPAVEAMEICNLTVEFENRGEIAVEVAFADSDTGDRVPTGREIMGKSQNASYGCKPASQILAAGATCKFKIACTGMREGKDTRTLMFTTPLLLKPMQFSFEASSTVKAAVDMRAMQQFAKADSSVEAKLSVDMIELSKFRSDEGLLHIFLPIVKIDATTVGRPGTPLHPISRVEPDLQYPSIVQHLVRPMAVSTQALVGMGLGAGPGGSAMGLNARLPGDGARRMSRGAARPLSASKIVRDAAGQLVPAIMARLQHQREAMESMAPLERKVFVTSRRASGAKRYK